MTEVLQSIIQKYLLSLFNPEIQVQCLWADLVLIIGTLHLAKE